MNALSLNSDAKTKIFKFYNLLQSMAEGKYNIHSDIKLDLMTSKVKDGYIIMAERDSKLYSVMSLEGTDENIFLVNAILKPINKEVNMRNVILKLNRAKIIPYHVGDMAHPEELLPTMARNYKGSFGKIDKFYAYMKSTPEFRKIRDKKFFDGIKEFRKTHNGYGDEFMKEYRSKSDGTSNLYQYDWNNSLEKGISVLLTDDMRYSGKLEIDESLKESILEFGRGILRPEVGGEEFKKLKGLDGKISKEQSFFL